MAFGRRNSTNLGFGNWWGQGATPAITTHPVFGNQIPYMKLTPTQQQLDAAKADSMLNAGIQNPVLGYNSPPPPSINMPSPNTSNGFGTGATMPTNISPIGPEGSGTGILGSAPMPAQQTPYQQPQLQQPQSLNPAPSLAPAMATNPLQGFRKRIKGKTMRGGGFY